jgi:hypothetical protein
MQKKQVNPTGPIAGMSLTAELGGRPWQTPPKYSTPEQALEFYLPRLTSPDAYDQLLDVLELGVPITAIADSMQTSGVMQGLHTVDVGLLVTPVIMEMLAYIGDDAGIEYNMGTDVEIDEDKISNSQIALAMRKMRNRLPEAVEDAKENESEPVDMVEDTEEPASMSGGLMARRQQ